MTDREPPPCHRCHQHIHDHFDYGVETCGSYVWPNSLVAAALDLNQAVRKLVELLLRPVASLLRVITPRRFR